MAEQPLPEGTDTIITGAGVSHDTVDQDSRFAPDDAPASEAKAGDDAAAPAGTFFERIESFRTQGYDKARDYAVQGKDKATGALDDLLRMLNDAADQIDAKVGSQYGDYARKAGESLGGFNDALKGKDVDELFADARAFAAKAPAVVVGTAAALGFVVARLAKAGLAERGDQKPSSGA